MAGKKFLSSAAKIWSKSSAPPEGLKTWKMSAAWKQAANVPEKDDDPSLARSFPAEHDSPPAINTKNHKPSCLLPPALCFLT